MARIKDRQLTWGEPFNVADFNSDIQKAIDTAKKEGLAGQHATQVSKYLGIPVVIPPGKYIIDEPIVLPRSGTYPGYCVYLMGLDRTSCIIEGSSSFPPNRALIEWEDEADVTWGGGVSELRLNIPLTVAGAKAIHYKATDLSTRAAVFAEHLTNATFKNLWITANNQYCEEAIYIEGLARYCNFENIFADFWPGITPTYNTVLIKSYTSALAYTFPSDLLYESVGINFSSFKLISGMGMLQGGSGTLLSGRFMHCTFDHIHNGNTAINNEPQFYFKDSAAIDVGLAYSEGGGSTPQLKIENSVMIDFNNCQLGLPEADSGGVGVELIDSHYCTFRNRRHPLEANGFAATGGAGSKLIKIDADSANNRFENFQSLGTLAEEVEDLSSAANRNYVEYFKIDPTPSGEGDILAREYISWDRQTVAPSSSVGDIGDRVYNSNPTPGGSEGWTKTTSGWKEFGLVST